MTVAATLAKMRLRLRSSLAFMMRLSRPRRWAFMRMRMRILGNHLPSRINTEQNTHKTQSAEEP